MFVTSKRCFINCLAQFMDYDQIRDANYYICDVTNNSRYVGFEQRIEYDDNGNPVVKQTTVSKPSIQRYHIVYGNGSLNPSCVVNAAILNNDEDKKTQLSLFQEHLMHPSTIGQVRDWLYNAMNRPKGNGLMILIINDEDHVRLFGHTICEYLANCFGEDIEFIDAQVRPEWIPGYPRYVGNKQFAEKLLCDQRDYELYTTFTQSMSQMGYDECRFNMITTLNQLNDSQLIHVYELLFPNDPLPPGNYTTNQMKEIIIGKSFDRMQFQQQPTKALSNVYTSNAYLDSLDAELHRFDQYDDTPPF